MCDELASIAHTSPAFGLVFLFWGDGTAGATGRHDLDPADQVLSIKASDGEANEQLVNLSSTGR
jgi:hypothetical protein